jgi:hypothetical protein
MEYVRVLHFWLCVCGGAKYFYLTLFKNPHGFIDVQESAAQWIGMTITDLAFLPDLLLPTFMVYPFFVQDYGLLHR